MISQHELRTICPEGWSKRKLNRFFDLVYTWYIPGIYWSKGLCKVYPGIVLVNDVLFKICFLSIAMLELLGQ